MREVLVIDYGVGNLLSIRRAFERCDIRVQISSNPNDLMRATHVILPGVGAFGKAMEELRKRELVDPILAMAKKGVHLLGICLGMQILMEQSEEFGIHTGLGLISGRVSSIPLTRVDGARQNIPHIGWSSLVPSPSRENFNKTLLQGLGPEEAVYFVHSFMANPRDPNHHIADCIYGGRRITAAVAKDNIFGCQFHPEKSGEVGLEILRRYLA